MNTYNISVNDVLVLKNVPESNLEIRKEQVADILFMKSRQPNLKEIEESISVSLNT
tara:strand:- start:1065 stop:1232 length:168 start_codon:yes stop_codon:yes gene_type:complete